MESYIQISKINDFLYSPLSLYLHGIYESFTYKVYHEVAQTEGRLNHQNIEEGKYSTAKRFLQGISIYSEKYNLGGKIDIFDTKTGYLIERKTKINELHKGQIFQLYAQMFALEEMGHKVTKLFIQSLKDNKRYNIPKPSQKEIEEFENVLKDMRSCDITKEDNNKYKCDLSIYRHLSF